MPEPAHHTFDFDAWSELARQNPADFETRRAQAIEDAIRQASPRTQMRLRRLQWKLDQVRRTSATPMVACVRINRMMWERITGPGGLLELLVEGKQAAPQRPRAQVLPLHRAR